MQKTNQRSWLTFSSIALGLLCLYMAAVLFACGQDSYCAQRGGFFRLANALDISVGSNPEDLNNIGKGTDPVVVTGANAKESEQKIIIRTDAVQSPPNPPPPRRSH